MIVTNKQIARALVKAIPHLWNGVSNFYQGQTYICHAIRSGDNRSWDHLSQATVAAIEIIENRLIINGNRKTFRTWLSWQPNVKSKDMTDQRVQAHRKEWLLMLIKEFSK